MNTVANGSTRNPVDAAQARPAVASPTPLMWFAFACFWVFEVTSNSRVLDLHFSSAHIPMALSILALFGAIAGGAIPDVFRQKAGGCMLALTALYGMSVPFSYWRGGSTTVFTQAWLRCLLVFVIAAAVITTFRQCRLTLSAIGIGTTLGAVLAIMEGRVRDGRLALEQGRFGNPNDLAATLLLGLPCLALIFIGYRSGVAKKVAAVLMMALVLVAIGQTGSRAALVSFAVLLLFAFFRLSIIGKFAFFIATVLLLMAFLTLLPHSTRARYMTILQGSDTNVETTGEAGIVHSAEGSTEQRKQLLQNSIRVTLMHPILGCGIGQFAPYMAQLDRDAGKQYSAWHTPHNTYTQISSEAGIPALLFFLALLWFSFRELQQVAARARLFHMPEIREVGKTAFALQAMLVAYAVGILFNAVAYDATLPTLMGLIVGFGRAARREFTIVEAETPSAAPAPSPPVRRAFRSLSKHGSVPRSIAG